MDLHIIYRIGMVMIEIVLVFIFYTIIELITRRHGCKTIERVYELQEEKEQREYEIGKVKKVFILLSCLLLFVLNAIIFFS